MREIHKHFITSVISAIGLILFWRGLWLVIDITPFVSNGLVSLLVGLFVLTFTGLIYHEFDPLSKNINGASRAVYNAIHNTKKGNLFLNYRDNHSKTNHKICAEEIKQLEHNIIVLHKSGKEKFIPIHRVTQVTDGKKIIWKK